MSWPHTAVLVWHSFRTLPQDGMEREWIAACLLDEIGYKAKQISDIRGTEIISVGVTDLFQQMLDNSTQVFTKIEFGGTKAMNEKQ